MELILKSNTPYEAKKLGYQVQGVDNKKWLEKRYDLCFEGVKAKFQQNPDLLNMFKTTYPKLIVEGTTDRTWGTGIHLRDPNALDRSKWQSNGWFSGMLRDIRNGNRNELGIVVNTIIQLRDD